MYFCVDAIEARMLWYNFQPRLDLQHLLHFALSGSPLFFVMSSLESRASYSSEKASNSEKDSDSDTQLQPSQSEVLSQVLQPLLPLEILKDSIKTVACLLGYDKLKKEQEESILNFAKGRDVFVSLPTGYGKSICYIILPWLFDELRKVDKKSIVLVVSPLIAVMRDKVGSITAMGITEVTKKLLVARKESRQLRTNCIFFFSPEALILLKWRNMLSNKVYRNNLVAFVVDEPHCIKKWYANGGIACVMVVIVVVVVLRGESFRKDFSDLGEIRSIVPRRVRLMALTATATLSTRKFIIKNLNMQDTAIVYNIPPLKNNIIYFVTDKPRGGISEAF